jgi:signal transduction histidine kinase/CheY-like chemotaxis protein
LQAKGYIHYENVRLESIRGRMIEVEVVANGYREDQHSVIQCNIRDTTERSRLERKTQEQAAALTDQHLRKDEFLAMLSHELRNPLAPILNAALLLRLQSNRNRLQGIENPILQQSAVIIERQVGQLAHIVDELLEVSRISTGRIHLQQKPIALGDVVENAVATVRSLMDQRKHELTVSLPTQAIWVHADAARLEQVVVNLLTNSAKYTDQGGRVWITVQQDGEEAVLRVRDTGIGMAPEILPRIFDLFTQAQRSLDRSQGGLGIGLALVQRLVEMHGGNVTVSSALGQGSEFVVRLPVVSPPQPQASSPPTETAQSTGPSLRVLVVDDNLDSVATLALLLKECGHDVRTAYDGPAALEAALDYRPNVVLLDIGLPGLDGFEVAKRLRQQPALQNTVLVAMTGYGAQSDLQRSFEAGFDHHLVKPGDIGKVLQILTTVSALTAQ